jgi:hypothetical protein
MKQSSRSGTFRGMFSWFSRKLKTTEVAQVETRIRGNTHITVVNPWHAVGISSGPACCRAALSLKNNRYLSHEAPQLPLAGCTQAKTCLCRYKHYSDRRRGPRRESERFESVLSRRVAARRVDERRTSRGRRATDSKATDSK